MKKLSILVSFFLASFLANSQNSPNYTLNSPSNNLTVNIEVGKNIAVSLSGYGKHAVELSNISLETSEGIIPAKNGKVKSITRNSVDENITPEIREKAAILTNKYNELVIIFGDKNSITFRLFDEGMAYHFSTTIKDSLTVFKENLNIAFSKSDSVHFQASETFNSSYETPYENRAIYDIEQGKLLCLPLLVEKQNGLKVMIAEAGLYNYPALWSKGSGESLLTVTNPNYPSKLKKSGNIYGQNQVAGTHEYIAKVKGTRTYPWRIFAVVENESGLIDNDMVYLLSEPNAIGDVSWIKPGVVMFDWWGKNNIYGVDFKSGINTETAKYYIDFCADFGFRYFLFDDGWSPLDNILTPREGLDMDEVMAHANDKGIDVMLWVLWNTLEKQFEEAFDLYEKWGIKGLKIDFMNRDDQPMVKYYEKVLKKAAEKKMVINFHGSYTPRGLRRKFPNLLTREGLIEFEYNGWTSHVSPDHTNMLPYIRMFAGPMDFIPGTMRNSTEDNFRPVGDYPMGQGTRANSIALWVVLNSPMTMLPDAPSDYYREEECTRFIAKLPVVWDETRLLEGEIGEYTVMARRSGNKWYVGAITNWDKRVIKLETSFLPPGNHRLEAIEDGVNADKRAGDYRLITRHFEGGEILDLNLAPGGGWVSIITPEE
ncbi:MAG: glycoside hydrolase family 97 protein [Bacteroidales bacterium]